MNSLHSELLVVLAPALACLLLCAVANAGALGALFVARVRRPLLHAWTSREHVNSLLSVCTNVMFVGSAVGVLYGSRGDMPLDRQLGVLVGLTFGLLVAYLSRRAVLLAKKEAAEQSAAIRAAVRAALRADRRACRRRARRAIHRSGRRNQPGGHQQE